MRDNTRDPRVMCAERVTESITHHGEGPCWYPAWGGLRIVDADAGAVVTLTDAGPRRLSVGTDLATFVRPRVGGGYVVGTRTGIGLADRFDEPITREVPLHALAHVRTNDGGTTPDGLLLAGSLAAGSEPDAALHLIDGDLGIRTLIPNVGCSNGIDFSPSGDLAYYVDTATGRIDRLRIAGGILLERNEFLRVPPEVGVPDGLTVDAEGTIWVALWAGSAVHGYAPDGTHVATIEVDARQVSACTFGGDDLRTLYITTSRQGLAPGEDPHAGSVFAVRPGSAGRPVTPFAG